MRVVDAIAEILRREGVEFLSCYPTTVMIEAAAAIGIRPVLCRQERVGVDIADIREAHILPRGEQLEVIRSHAAGADQCDRQWVAGIGGAESGGVGERRGRDEARSCGDEVAAGEHWTQDLGFRS